MSLNTNTDISKLTDREIQERILKNLRSGNKKSKEIVNWLQFFGYLTIVSILCIIIYVWIQV